MILCSLRNINLPNTNDTNLPNVNDTNLTNANDTHANKITIPVAVSIVAASCRQPRNLVRVVNLCRSPSTNGSGVQYAANFSVCVPPVFGNFDDVSDLVEFIEVNRVLGAQKFLFYVHSVGSRVDPCLREYVRRGTINIQPWKLPADVARVIYYNGQILAMNECLYRMMYRTKYLIIQDVDEFVVPMTADNWMSMINRINNDSSAAKAERIASYSFRNRFFPTEFPKTSNFTPPSILQHPFKTLVFLRAHKGLSAFNDRSKVMARPERVVIWHVHVILDSSLVRTGDINAKVSANFAQLFHYRRGLGAGNTIEVSRMNTFAESIQRRLRVATVIICITGDYL